MRKHGAVTTAPASVIVLVGAVFLSEAFRSSGVLITFLRVLAIVLALLGAAMLWRAFQA
jgi:hypothetical protein